MTITLTREEAQQVLECMETAIKAGDWVIDGACDPDFILHMLRARLAQPEPEPVAWMFDQAKYRENDLRGRQWAFNVFSQTKPYMDEMVQNVTPLYKDPTPCQTCEALARTVMMDQTSHDTAPPQRPWQGLTGDEIEELWGGPVDCMFSGTYKGIRAIEAKLKEKNGGY